MNTAIIQTTLPTSPRLQQELALLRSDPAHRRDFTAGWEVGLQAVAAARRAGGLAWTITTPPPHIGGLYFEYGYQAAEHYQRDRTQDFWPMVALGLGLFSVAATEPLQLMSSPPPESLHLFAVARGHTPTRDWWIASKSAFQMLKLAEAVKVGCAGSRHVVVTTVNEVRRRLRREASAFTRAHGFGAGTAQGIEWATRTVFLTAREEEKLAAVTHDKIRRARWRATLACANSAARAIAALATGPDDFLARDHCTSPPRHLSRALKRLAEAQAWAEATPAAEDAARLWEAAGVDPTPAAIAAAESADKRVSVEHHLRVAAFDRAWARDIRALISWEVVEDASQRRFNCDAYPWELWARQAS